MPEVPVEDSNGPELPNVIYSNLVGVHFTNDDTLLEFWEHRIGPSTPAMSTEEIAQVKAPRLRIVIPFSSAKWLRDFLDQSIPVVEKNRKAGD